MAAAHYDAHSAVHSLATRASRDANAMAWRSDSAHYHSRLAHQLAHYHQLAQCFPGANLDPGATVFAAYEDKAWEEASSWKSYCEGLARCAAYLGHKGCLRALHELGGDAAASVAAAEDDGWTPAHYAADNGHKGCLRVLHKLGGEAAASLASANARGRTPAHLAADKGHKGCLRVLHELGGEAAASLAAVTAEGGTPAHLAACGGHEGCLLVLYELGGEAALSLAAEWDGGTPAHLAANKGHEGCLRVLHELLCMMIDPQLAVLAESVASTARDNLVAELRARRSLAWTQGTKPFDHVDLTTRQLWSAAAWAASNGHAGCFRYLAEIGGAAAFLESLIDSKFRWLLAEPALLNLGPRLAPTSPAPVPAPDAPAPVPARNPPAPSPPAPDESAGAMPVSLVDAICIVLLASAIALCLYSLHIALLLILLHFSSAYLILKKMWLHIALLLDLLLLGYLILN